jgi:hypothetical protein
VEYLIVVFISLLFVFLDTLPFTAGVVTTPKDMVFLGTVHWPGDYFYYLSQFAQGKYGWFGSYDLYTTDYPVKTLVGWVNVAIGRIFYLLGSNQIIAYQITIAFFVLAFLFISYFLIREIFPEGKTERITAFIFFVISNSFPMFVWVKGKLEFWYYDYWFTNGLPFNRLGGVPHHLIVRTFISLAFLLAIRWWNSPSSRKAGLRRSEGRKNILRFVSFLLVGFVIVSIDPVHWGLVFGTLLSVPVIYYLSSPIQSGIHTIIKKYNFIIILRIIKCMDSRFRGNDMESVTEKITQKPAKINQFFLYLLLPGILIFAGGFFMALYLKKLFMSPPYLQLTDWEAGQQLRLPFYSFIMSNGPVMVLAFLGVIPFLRKITLEKLMVVFFWAGTIFLFFSPVPLKVNIVNVRFLPATTTLFAAIIAADFVMWIQGLMKSGYQNPNPETNSNSQNPKQKSFGNSNFGIVSNPGFRIPDLFKPKKQTRRVISLIFPWLVLILVLAIITPSYIPQVSGRFVNDKGNSFFYVSPAVVDMYRKAEALSDPKDNFLVLWPFNWSFPAMTGRHVYYGHQLLTTDYARKETEAYDFFLGRINQDQMEFFLQKNNIKYVITHPWMETTKSLPFLDSVYDNGFMVMYQYKG